MTFAFAFLLGQEMKVVSAATYEKGGMLTYEPTGERFYITGVDVTTPSGKNGLKLTDTFGANSFLPYDSIESYTYYTVGSVASPVTGSPAQQPPSPVQTAAGTNRVPRTTVTVAGSDKDIVKLQQAYQGASTATLFKMQSKGTKETTYKSLDGTTTINVETGDANAPKFASATDKDLFEYNNAGKYITTNDGSYLAGGQKYTYNSAGKLVDQIPVPAPDFNSFFSAGTTAQKITVNGKQVDVLTKTDSNGVTYGVDKSNGQTYQVAGGIGTTVGSNAYEGGSLFGFFKTTDFATNFVTGNLLDGITHAVIAAGIAAAIASLAGLNSQQTAAASKAAAAGAAGYNVARILFQKGTPGNQGVFSQYFGITKIQAGLIGAGIAVAVFIATYKKESQKFVTFQCLPWEPKLGGSSCEECNKDPLRPCSEYRCKSLGQACQLLNPKTDKAQCAWVSKGDVQSPTIQEWGNALKPGTLQYTPNNALRPGARGVKIISTQTDDNCLPAFTDLQFGILTNEPAQCKVDYNRSLNFDSMQYYFGESNYYEYNHTQRMRLPAPDSEDTDLSPLLQNDGTFAMFVRCRDANGNVNEDEYSINFCVSAGPDTTPPIIEGTSLEDGSPVRFGADTVPIEVYTNEPATCKWSINDKDYAEMENALRCAENAAQINADLQYTCAGNLTGIQNNVNKEFYFRCVDQPGAPEAERNEMRESHKLTLRGTQELSLLLAGPNATTIQASTTAVSVELFAQTDDGADEGKATCYFSPTGIQGSYIEFFETDAIDHKQILSLSAGNYSYYIRCVDAGGNAVNTNIQFGVGVDKGAPQITRVYRRSSDALQINTNEDAQCFYSKTSCNFNIEEGLPFSYSDPEQQRVHLAEWKSKSAYYIKCKDKYGNEPSPNSCSIVVSGVDLSTRAVI